MLPHYRALRAHLTQIIREKGEQGHIIAGLPEELASLPDSYDALWAFALRVSDLPLKPDWPYVEPSEHDAILAECDPRRPTAATPVPDARQRAETAFLASCCGCILGKPLEINPTLADLKKASEAIGEWPISQYISEKIAPHLPRALHGSWPNTTRENIRFVDSDDDINYTLLGMLVIEKYGIHFTKKQLAGLWREHLPISATFGPERTTLLKAGIDSYHGNSSEEEMTQWAAVLSPREEYCGALIRADAYGYACAGNPALAAELAGRDAAFTHRRTGIYGTIFVAAAIAMAFTQPKNRLDIFRTALMFIPQRSRLYHILSGAIDDVASSKDWLEAYDRIHAKHYQWDHCRVFQELATLINTLHFARDLPDGLCKQVSQGNDTDSFGATAGSILGAYFGTSPQGRPLLEPWLAPFNDDLRTALASYYERSLLKNAHRMGELPQLVADELSGKRVLGSKPAPVKNNAAAGI